MARLTRSKSAAMVKPENGMVVEIKKEIGLSKNEDVDCSQKSIVSPGKKRKQTETRTRKRLTDNPDDSVKTNSEVKNCRRSTRLTRKTVTKPLTKNESESEFENDSSSENKTESDDESDFDSKPPRKKSITNGRQAAAKKTKSNSHNDLHSKKETTADEDDDDSDDDGEDWEEVEDFDIDSYKPELPDTIQIMIQKPSKNKAKQKDEWIRMCIRCAMNHMRKRSQLNAHKAHLLLFMSRLQYLNEIINGDFVRALAMSLDHSGPTKELDKETFVQDFLQPFMARFDLNFNRKVKNTKKPKHLVGEIMETCETKKFHNPLIFNLIIIATLRNLGHQARLCYFLRPVPIKPANLLTKKTRFKKNQSEPIPFEKERISDAECYWMELLDRRNERWFSFDPMSWSNEGQDDGGCMDSYAIAARLKKKYKKDIAYVFAIDNSGHIADVTFRYATNWLSYDRVKSRIEDEWLPKTLALVQGFVTDRSPKKKTGDYYDKIECDDLINRAELPKRKSDYKNHPLFVLQRDLLKFQALYPADAPPVGFYNDEPIYARECVYTLKSRETWLRDARTVKPYEKAYKMVMSKFKKKRGFGMEPERQPMELFGVWQTVPYEPPVAKEGIVPRNAFGNVDLYHESMLPRGTVHLRLPGAIARIAARMGIDCVPAIVGFDNNRKGMGSHPVIDGYVVCREFERPLLEEWKRQQAAQLEKDRDRRLKRIYENWRRLMRSLTIRHNLKIKYG